MPKQKYIIRDFSGGMNTKRDPRDIAENESSFINNMSIDAIGKIKTSGGLYAHIESNDGTTNLSEYFVESLATIVGGGGYGAFYFESDHGRSSTESITLTHHTNGTSLTIGTSDGNISFGKVSSGDGVDLSAAQDVIEPN
tara:strand:- start:12036 stop:12455 length:420 start_codon:yes stop_codon:yes gene_type:complete